MKRQEIAIVKEWARNCPNPNNNPNCKKILIYSTKGKLTGAIKKNTVCYSCAKSGENNPMHNKKMPEHSKRITGKNNPMYGRSVYSIWLEKYGKEEADKRNKERNEKISKNHADMFGKNNGMYGKTGNKHPMYGKCAYDIWLEKYGVEEANKRQNKSNYKNRKTQIKQITERVGQVMPNYNPNSIPILEAKAKELGIDDLQHAENGGEFHIKELGYWVDGYSKEKNIVIEYYEPFHERQKDRDEYRKKEIIEYLDCKFIEMREK